MAMRHAVPRDLRSLLSKRLAFPVGVHIDARTKIDERQRILQSRSATCRSPRSPRRQARKISDVHVGDRLEYLCHRGNIARPPTVLLPLPALKRSSTRLRFPGLPPTEWLENSGQRCGLARLGASAILFAIGDGVSKSTITPTLRPARFGVSSRHGETRRHTHEVTSPYPVAPTRAPTPSSCSCPHRR